MSSHPRLGICCKIVPDTPDPTEAKALARSLNVTTVTLAYLGRQSPAAAFDKLSAVVTHNLEVVRRQIEFVAGLAPMERMLRLSSDLLPGFTHPSCAPYYADADLRSRIERELGAAGELARRRDVRLSMHPGQFCVLATASESALANAVAEVEYHAWIMTLLGYGDGWHPHGAHINVHGGARAPGIETFRANLGRLSRTARNLLTVENDEVMYGLDDLLPLADSLPIVVDFHHHWIASRGEYIEPGDPRIARVIESWRGVRPVSHISVSREDLLAGHDPGTAPDFAALARQGVSARDLRGHSDRIWNEAVADLVIRHLAWSDVEVEAKAKNLASGPLARRAEAALGDEVSRGRAAAE